MVRVHRLVLLALFAPILAVAVVLWFLLPGSIAGQSYSPMQYFREAHLQPQYWSAHRASIRGYVYPDTSSAARSEEGWMMLDAPAPRHGRIDARIAVLVLRQHESGWHDLMRRLTPGLLAKPFPGDIHPGSQVTVAGRLRAGYTGIGLPVLQPDDL